MDFGKTIASGVCAVVLILLLIMGIKCTTKVPAGYVATQYSMSGGLREEVLTQGFHITSPLVSTTLYTVSLEQSYLTSGKNGDSSDDESFVASSKEGKAVTLDLTFTYQYQAENVVAVFNRFKGQSGKEVKDSFIKPNIISWTKEVVSKFAVSEMIGAEREAVNAALTDYVSKKFEPYGITISNVTLINIDVDAETMDAINAKITAQQNAETQKINNQTAIDKANADAEVKRTEAQASADAQRIKAEAEAESNRMIAESLTEEIIEYEKVQKWNGDVPTVQGNTTPVITMDMNDLSEQEEQ